MRDFALGALTGAFLLLLLLWSIAGLEALGSSGGAAPEPSGDSHIASGAIEKNARAIEALAESMSSLGSGIEGLRSEIAGLRDVASAGERKLAASPPPTTERPGAPAGRSPGLRRSTGRGVAFANWPSQMQVRRLPQNVKNFAARYKADRHGAVQELFMATPLAVMQKLGTPDDCYTTDSGHMVWRYYPKEARNVRLDFYKDRVLRIR